MYQGLGDACHAVADGDPDKWDTAKRALTATDRIDSCPDWLARELLARLVEAHERSPAAQIRFHEAVVSPRDACR